jgi:hypothetical protein
MARAASSLSCFHAIAATRFALAFAIPHAAFAYVGPPYLTPAQPTENDVVELSMYRDNCEIIDGGFPGPPVVTQQGTKLTILLTGAHEDDPLFCIYGSGVETHAVGRFPPGSYTLDVERRYTVFGGWVQEKLGDLDFTVTEAASSSVAESAPTLSMDVLFLLTIATAGIAMQQLHFRRRESSQSMR